MTPETQLKFLGLGLLITQECRYYSKLRPFTPGEITALNSLIHSSNPMELLMKCVQRKKEFVLDHVKKICISAANRKYKSLIHRKSELKG